MYGCDEKGNMNYILGFPNILCCPKGEASPVSCMGPQLIGEMAPLSVKLQQGAEQLVLNDGNSLIYAGCE